MKCGRTSIIRRVGTMIGSNNRDSILQCLNLQIVENTVLRILNYQLFYFNELTLDINICKNNLFDLHTE